MTDQRVEGGRLFISGVFNLQSARQLATKVMSNGVEVIVKGNKTTLGGNQKSPTVPAPISPVAITLPPYTVSRQFHLIDHPNKLNNAIDHLLHSIVKSVSPDLVTKTLLTTFTFFSTILENNQTIVNSHKETISNVVTQKFRPTIEYTPRIQETSTLLPEHLDALSSYFINTMTTTYVYHNTFTADSIPVVISRTELVSNVITIPAYMVSQKSHEPMMSQLSSTEMVTDERSNYIFPTYSRVFETETYYSTLLFSKTIFEPEIEPSTSKILTTQQLLTQVVVTEALVPVDSTSIIVEPTPLFISPSLVEKTFYTTFTHFSTFKNGSDSFVQSRTSLSSNVVTEELVLIEKTLSHIYYDDNEQPMATPSITPLMLSSSLITENEIHSQLPSDSDSVSFLVQNNIIDSGNIDEYHLASSVLPTSTAGQGQGLSSTKLYEPVLIYRTVTYYTTFTYFTSIVGEGPTETKIQSRTQVVSRVTTEALSTELNVQYLAALKQSYLSQYSTLLEVTSSVHEIIPTRTIEGSYMPDEPSSSIIWPHWPKDEDEGIVFPLIQDSQPKPILSSLITIEPILVHKDFEESMSSEIRHVVNVLTDTILGGASNFSLISPTPTYFQHSSLYSTLTDNEHFGDSTQYEEITLKTPENEIADNLQDDEFHQKWTSPSSDIELDDSSNVHLSSISSHLPTPPLANLHTSAHSFQAIPPSSIPTVSIKTEAAVASTPKVTTSSIMDNKENFPDFTDEGEPHDDNILANVYNDMNYGDISSLVDIFISSKYSGKISASTKISSAQPTASLASPIEFDNANSLLLLKKTGLSPVFDYSSVSFDYSYEPLMSMSSSSSVDYNKYMQSQLIFDLLSELHEDSTEAKNPDYYDTITEDDVFKETEHDNFDTTNVFQLSDKETTFKPFTTVAESKEEEPEKKTVTLGTLERPFAEEVDSTEGISQITTKSGEDDLNEHVSTTQMTSIDNDASVPSGIELHQEFPPSGSASSSSSGEVITVITFTPNGSANRTEIKLAKPATDLTTTSAPVSKKPVFSFQKNKPAPTLPPTSSTKESKLKPPVINDDNDDYADEPESATKVYNLIIKGNPDKSSDSDDNGEDDDDDEGDNDSEDDVKKENEKNEEENNKSEEENEEVDLSRRPPTMFSGPSKIAGTGTGSTGGGTGPSTNSGNAGGIPIVSTAGGSGINWKPLLNLGAIGLGGLGASTLTKLSPLLSSMAGYLKHGFSPVIARNDTQHMQGSHYYKNEPPFPNRGPPKYEGSLMPFPHKEPNIIPIGQHSNIHQQRPTHLLRQPDDNIPRRPVISHAPATNQESNFHGHNRRPMFPHQQGPHLPNNNFQPPNDVQPNIYSISNVNTPNDPKNPSSGGQGLPSSHIVKVVAGKPVNALLVNRAPTFHNFLRNSGEKNQFGTQKRPTFVRPPPRSQEGPPPTSFQNTILLPLPPQNQAEEEDEIVEENKSVAVSHSQEQLFHPNPQHNLLRPPPPTEMEYINRPSTMPKPRPGQSDSNEQANLLFPPRVRIPNNFENHQQSSSPPLTVDHINISPEQSQESSFDIKQKQWPIPPSHNANFHTGEKFGGDENPFTQQANNNHQLLANHQMPTDDSDNEESDGNHHHQNHPVTHDTFFMVTEKIPVQSQEQFHSLQQRPHPPSQYHIQTHGPSGQGTVTRLRNPPLVQGPMLQPRPSDGPSLFEQHPQQVQHFGQQNSPDSSEELLRTEQGQFIRHQLHQHHLQHPSMNVMHIPQIPAINIDHQPFRPILNDQHPLPPPPPHMQQINRPPQQHFNNEIQNHQYHQQQQPKPPHSVISYDFMAHSSIRPHNNMEIGNGGNLRPQLNEDPENEFPRRPHPVLLPGLNQIPAWPSEGMHVIQGGVSEQRPEFSNMPTDNQHQLHNSDEQQQNQIHESQPLLPGFFSPTPHSPPYQQRPSTIFFVHETYDPPPTEVPPLLPPQDSSHDNEDTDEDGLENSISDNSVRSSTLRPPVQELIINEIPPSTTPRPSTGKLHPAFIRTKAGLTSTTTSAPPELEEEESEELQTQNNSGGPMKSGGFILSPTVSDFIDQSSSPNYNLIKDIGNHKYELDESPATHNGTNHFHGLSSTSASVFNLDKYFTNIGGDAQTFSGSEDNVSVVDPSNNYQVVKSPFEPTSTRKSSVDEDDSDGDSFLNAFTVPDGFLSQIHDQHKPIDVDDDDFWTGTTYRPHFNSSTIFSSLSSTTPLSYNNQLLWHNIFPTQGESSSTLTPIESNDVPTTYRNVLQPTTFRPNLVFRRPPHPPSHLGNSAHNQNESPSLISSASSHANSNLFYDDEEGLENIKLKNVEIHKQPQYVKRPLHGTGNQNLLNNVHQHPVLAFIPTSEEEESDDGSSPVLGNGGQQSTGFKKPFYSIENEELSTDENEEDLSDIINSSNVADIMKTNGDKTRQNIGTNNNKPKPNQNGNKQNEEEDTNETFEFGPPGYPMDSRFRPPGPPFRQQPPGVRFNDHSNVNAQNGRRPILRPVIPHPNAQQHGPGAHPPPPQHQQPQRPAGPFDAITNLFRRPNRPTRPEQGDRRPPPPPENIGPSNFIRKPPPPPPPPHTSNNQAFFGRPQLNPESSFNKIRPIPLNPAADNANQFDNNNANPNHQLRRPPIPPELVRRPQEAPVEEENSVDQRPDDAVHHDDLRRPENNNKVTQNVRPNINFVRRPINSQEFNRRPQHPGQNVQTDHLKPEENLKESTNHRPSTEENDVEIEEAQNYSNEKHKAGSEDKDNVIEKPSENQPAPTELVHSQEFEASAENGHESKEEEFGSLKDGNNNSPMHIGGHILHNRPNFRRRPHHGKKPGHRIRKPKPFPPKAGTFVLEPAGGHPPSSESTSSIEIHEYGRQPPPKTEMEPPPIDSLHQKPSILEFPTVPPTHQHNNNRGPHQRPQGHANIIRYRQRPNLLRPEPEVLKPTLTKPKPTFHTIASVDDDNKIVATNVVQMIHNHHYYSRHEEESSKNARVPPIRPSQTSENTIVASSTANNFENSAENEPVEFELSSSIVDPEFDDSSEGSSNKESSSRSVVRYEGGSLKTVALPEHEEPEEDEDEEDVESTSRMPTRKHVMTKTRMRISTKFSSGESESEQITPTRTIGGFTPINAVSATKSMAFPFPGRRPFTRPRFTTTSSSPTTTDESESSTTKSVISRRPFIPTRSPAVSNTLLPWNRRLTSTTTTSKPVVSSKNESSDDSNLVDENDEPKTSISTSSSSTSSIKDRVIIPFKNRTRLNFFSTTKSTTTSTTTEHSVSTAPQDSSSSIVSPIALPPTVNYKPTTFRPAIRPNLIASSKEHATFNIKPVPNSTTTDAVSSNELDLSFSTNGVKTSTHISITSTESSSSEEEDDNDTFKHENEIKAEVLTKNGSISIVTSSTSNANHNNHAIPKIIPSRPSSSSSPSVSVSSSRGKISVVTSVSSGSSTKIGSPIDIVESTRFVTYTETSTQTVTETETTVVSAVGANPITHTIMITKTLPPQTLISTIIGSVTLVNSVEVKPTTVRSTITSEPTKSIYGSTGGSTLSQPPEKVLHGQFGIIKMRPAAADNKDSQPIMKSSTLDPMIDSSSTHISITSKESSSSSNSNESSSSKKKIRPYLLHPGCETHNCTMQGNQMCKAYANGTRSKCVCSPGYARVKLNAPCRPTFTYEMNFAINHMDGLTFNYKDLKNEASDAYLNFITMTKDALDKIFFTTVLTKDFQGTEVMRIDPTITKNEETHTIEPKVTVDFLIQIRKNMTTDKIKNQLIRTLRASNFTMGKAGIILSSSNISDFSARDFNECATPDFNDCGDNAECLNVPGSYRCQCLNGFKDRSKRRKPGRDCVEMAGCAECNYRGNCYTNRVGQTACNCFRWYGGSQCHVNLKILLMAIIGIVGVLFLFVLLCGVIICRRKKGRNPGRVLTGPGSGGFIRYRSPTSRTTLERTAIMHDSASSSSDGSRSPPTRSNLHSHHQQPQQHSFTPDSLLVDSDDNKNGRHGGDLMNFSLRNVVMDQDRSLTVVIPRAKIRASSRPSSRPIPGSSTALGPDTTSDLAAAESKLMSFLDPASGSKHVPHPPRMPGESSSRQSTAQRSKEAKARKLSLQERRISSGALVSSGTEVSARGGMRRRSTGLEPDLPIRPYEKATSSDVRSYDETTVRSHARPLFSSETSRASCYSCKPPSYCAYSESATGHTMAEKDGASTVYTTQGKLFRLSNDTDSNISSD